MRMRAIRVPFEERPGVVEVMAIVRSDAAFLVQERSAAELTVGALLNNSVEGDQAGASLGPKVCPTLSIGAVPQT